jgi:peptide/nickel transport system substrate-binding protein
MSRFSSAAKGAAILAAATLTLAGCAAAPGSGPDEPTTLNWSFYMPTSWDPVTSSTGNDINILSLVYASITQLDEVGNAIPGLAESWEYTEDGSAVTFTLRPDLEFSDGTVLDAQAVSDSLTRGKEQENSLIKGQLAAIESITVEDELNFTLHLNKVDYQLPNILAGRTGEVVSPTAAAEDAEALPTAPVGAGPFILTEFVPESNAVLVKNPDYWRADEIHIDTLNLTVAADPATVVQAVQSGSLDVVTLDASQIEQAEAAGIEVEVIKSLQVNNLNINNTIAPFTDPAVLEAIRYAVDRDEIVETLTYGTADPTFQSFPKGYVGYNPELEDLYSYDPEKSIEILEEAGYAPGEVTFTITTMSIFEVWAQLLQAQFEEAGFTVNIEVVPVGSSTWQQKVYLDGRSAQLATDGSVGR